MRTLSKILQAAAVAALALAAASAQAAEPPMPGSTAEYKAANEAHFLATWTPVFQVSPEQAEKNRRTAAEAWPKVLRLMPAACDKGDAKACEAIATSQSLFLKLPNPRAARQQAATRASAGYGHFCKDVPQACGDWERFLKALETVDQQNPTLATTVLPGAWVDLARSFDRQCRASTGEVFSIMGDCEKALGLYESRAPDQWRSLREHLCSRNHSSSCHKLGRLTAKEIAKDKDNAAKCSAGQARGCIDMSVATTQRTGTPGAAEEGRRWAAKGCELNDLTACMILGELMIASQYGGTPDPAGSLAAFAKACKLPVGQDPANRERASQDQKRACETEGKIRDWMAKQPR